MENLKTDPDDQKLNTGLPEDEKLKSAPGSNILKAQAKRAENMRKIKQTPLDPSKPLLNPRYEKMCQLVVKHGNNWTDAYIKTSETGFKSRDQARSNASNVKRKPKVVARFEYLRDQASLVPAKTQSVTPSPGMAVPEDLPTKDYLLRVLTGIVQSGGADSTTLNATEKLLRHLEAETEEELVLNPDLIANHMCTFAGWPGEQIVREAGGLSFLIERMSAICKVSPADIAVAASALE